MRGQRPKPNKERGNIRSNGASCSMMHRLPETKARIYWSSSPENQSYRMRHFPQLAGFCGGNGPFRARTLLGRRNEFSLRFVKHAPKGFEFVHRHVNVFSTQFDAGRRLILDVRNGNTHSVPRTKELLDDLSRGGIDVSTADFIDPFQQSAHFIVVDIDGKAAGAHGNFNASSVLQSSEVEKTYEGNAY